MKCNNFSENKRRLKFLLQYEKVLISSISHGTGLFMARKNTI